MAMNFSVGSFFLIFSGGTAEKMSFRGVNGVLCWRRSWILVGNEMSHVYALWWLVFYVNYDINVGNSRASLP